MERAKELLDSMSLEQKVGQLIQIGIPSSRLREADINHLKTIQPGGIIYFSRNIKDPLQVRELSLNLQELSSTPLLISIDQEGGSVMRIVDGVTVFPGNMALGATASTALAYQAGRITGEELYPLGINTNLAPVLDVINNPQNPVIGLRSFGEAPKLVAKMGSAFALGLQDAKIIATGKHFPGHGDTDADSHHCLPVVPYNRKRLDAVELLPFREAIKNGLQAVMTAHVVFPAMEPNTSIPATLSENILTGLLRKEFGFQGIIMTDCMEMKAISDSVGTAEGSVRTIEAGADMVLVSHTRSLQLDAYKALLYAVESGRITEERIDQSALRILKAKLEFGVISQDFKGVEISHLPKENLETGYQIAQGAITVIKGQELLPLTHGRIGIIDITAAATTIAEDIALRPPTLGSVAGKAISSHLILSFQSSLEADKAKIKDLDADIYVIATMDAHLFPKQIEVIKELQSHHKAIFAVGLKTPYEFRVLNKYVDGYLAAYSYCYPSLKAAWEVLIGKNKAPGILPVTI